MPGQPKQVGRPYDQQRKLDLGKQGGQQGAEQRAQKHHDGKSGPDAEVEGERAPESQAAGIGHGQNVIGARRDRRDHGIGQKMKPAEHKNVDLPLKNHYNR